VLVFAKQELYKVEVEAENNLIKNVINRIFISR